MKAMVVAVRVQHVDVAGVGDGVLRRGLDGACFRGLDVGCEVSAFDGS